MQKNPTRMRPPAEAIFKAIFNNDLIRLDRALMSGGDPNVADSREEPAINFAAAMAMFAALHGHAGCFELMVKAGARMEAKNSDGHTAIDIAEQSEELKELVVLARGMAVAREERLLIEASTKPRREESTGHKNQRWPNACSRAREQWLANSQRASKSERH